MIVSIVLFVAVWVGVGLAALFKRNLQLGTPMLLAFSGAFLFAVSVLHLIPDLYSDHNHLPGLFMLIGFIVQFLLDFLSRGVEHGHSHGINLKSGLVPISVFVGLFLHAILEGIPTGSMEDQISLRGFTLAVALHKLPISMVLYILLRETGAKGYRLWLPLVAFSLMSPLGNLAGSDIPLLIKWMPHISAFVIGIFLHVSTTILYESNKDHRFNLTKLAVVIAGACLAWLTVLH